jgi:hypothetical protein
MIRVSFWGGNEQKMDHLYDFLTLGKSFCNMLPGNGLRSVFGGRLLRRDDALFLKTAKFRPYHG